MVGEDCVWDERVKQVDRYEDGVGEDVQLD